MTQHALDGTIGVPSPSITANTMSLWLRLFLAFGLFCLAGLGGLLWWQQHTFSDGFLNYLDSVSQKQAQRAALRLATEYTKTGSWKALRAEPGRMGRLVDDDTALQPASIPTESPANTPGDGAPRGAPGYGPPRVPPARGLSTSVALGMRLRLSDIDHRYVAGNTDPTPSRLPVVPVVVNGQQVGQLEISPLPPADGSLEAEFAAGQWRSIGVAGAVAAARKVAARARAMVGSFIVGNLRVGAAGSRLTGSPATLRDLARRGVPPPRWSGGRRSAR